MHRVPLASKVLWVACSLKCAMHTSTCLQLLVLGLWQRELQRVQDRQLCKAVCVPCRVNAPSMPLVCVPTVPLDTPAMHHQTCLHAIVLVVPQRLQRIYAPSVHTV